MKAAEKSAILQDQMVDNLNKLKEQAEIVNESYSPVNVVKNWYYGNSQAAEEAVKKFHHLRDVGIELQQEHLALEAEIAEHLAKDSKHIESFFGACTSVGNFLVKSAGGFVTGCGLQYASSAVGKGWGCYKGKNEGMEEANRRCRSRIINEEEYAAFKNGVDRTKTFFEECKKEAPPLKEVAMKTAAGMAGSAIAVAVGGLFATAGALPPVATLSLGVTGSALGNLALRTGKEWNILS